jgi:signal transduction histidine kinase
VKLFDPQIEAPGRPRIQRILQLADNLPTVAADPEQLRRALRNLVLNALDAMPKGGTLTLRTQRLDGPAERKIALEVSDTGEGLTPEECARLFTPYYTTKQHGTGLGLAIVQSVVSDHKGTITVRSKPGKGATFRIELKA